MIRALPHFRNFSTYISATFKDKTVLVVTRNGPISTAVLEGALNRGHNLWRGQDLLYTLNNREIVDSQVWQEMFTQFSKGATEIHFVNTMGMGIQPRRQPFDDINETPIRAAIDDIKETPIRAAITGLQQLKIRKKIAQISSIAAAYFQYDPTAPSHFDRDGAEFCIERRKIDRLLMSSKIPTTVLRPGCIFTDAQKDGTIDTGYDYSPEQFAKLSFHPLVGSGKQRHQPVYIGDLLQALFNGLESDQTQVVNAVGPETMTQAETIKFFVDLANRPFKPIHMHGEMAAVIAKHYPKGMLTSHAVAILRYLDETILEPFSKEPFEKLVGKPLTSMRQVYTQR